MAKQAPPRVIVIRPPEASEDVARLETACRARATAEGLQIRTYSARLVATRKEEWGRKVQMLEPQHAGALYRALHREAVLVLAFTTVWVRRDPRRDPPTRRAALKLETFVEHKAIHRLIRADKDVDLAFNNYAAWCSGVHCTGEDDARVLPLHVFETTRSWSTLGTSAGDQDFGRRYGSARRRVDEGGKTWGRAARGAYHGGDALAVAGQRLAPGMHWDVSVQRGPVLICSADEVWSLKGHRGYVNIHPDAHVRSTKWSHRRWAAGAAQKRK